MRQPQLDGFERESIGDLDDAIGRYIEAKDAAAESRELLRLAREQVFELLERHDVHVYRWRDGETALNVSRVASLKLKLEPVVSD